MAYQINSMYLLPEDAWTYELTGPCGAFGTVAGLAVVIPDRTPDAEQFTPADAIHAYVAAVNGPIPWLLLLRFIRFVETSGDVVAGAPTNTVTGDLSLSLNSWRLADRVFEVNSYHDDERGGWCYELYELDPTRTSNEYVDVRIPDLQPIGGPFVPAAAREVVLAGHGSPTFPWPVFRHFLDTISAGGDIVEEWERPMI